MPFDIDNDAKEIRWMGLRMCVPRTWEIKRHGISPVRGSLIFVDRRRQRLEINWQRPPKRPHIAHTLEQSIERLRDRDRTVRITQMPDTMGWQGFVYGAEPRFYRGMRFEAEHDCLLQVTLCADGEREESNALARAVLGSIQLEESPEKARHWCVFGLDCTVPDGCVLERAKVFPMDVTLEFDGGKRHRVARRRASFVVRRMGMARDWFNGDTEAFARDRTRSTGPRTHTLGSGPDRVVETTGNVPRFFFLGEWGPQEDESLRCWFSPVVNSMYVMTLRDGSRANLTLNDFTVKTHAASLAVA